MTRKRRIAINPGDSTFLSCGVLSRELADFIRALFGGGRESYPYHRPGCPLGGIELCEDIVACISSLEKVNYFWLDFQDDWDDRTDEEVEADDRTATKPETLTAIFSEFLPELTPEQTQQLTQLLDNAAEEGMILGKVHGDSRDGFQVPVYFHRDFALKKLVLDARGRVVGCRERPDRKNTVVIPGDVTVAEGAFRPCRSVQRIIALHNSVLEPGAFAGCTSLQELSVSPYQFQIPVGLCQGCTELRKVELTKQVNIIERNAFAGCVNLEEISLPENILFVHESAFDGCEKLPAAVREKLREFPTESEFRKRVAEAEKYIRANGDSRYKAGPMELYWLFPLKATYEKWHKLYDPYFEVPKTLPKGAVKYCVYGKLDASMEGYGWKLQKSFGKTVNIMVVDTTDIPNIWKFYNKQKALEQGNLEGADKGGENMLEKAVKAKNAGQPVRFITKAHLLKCIKKGAFA